MNIRLAVFLIILGILFDSIDGFLARKLNAESQFGAFLDSKADYITFGIAPAAIIYTLLLNTLGNIYEAALVAMIYFCSVFFRLRRFNKGGHQDFFQGLPSPIGAALIALSSVSIYLSKVDIYVGICIFSSLVMVSKLPYAHFDIIRKHSFFKVCNIFVGIFTILSIFQLLGLFHSRQWMSYEILFGLLLVYVFSPVYTYLYQIFKKT